MSVNLESVPCYKLTGGLIRCATRNHTTKITTPSAVDFHAVPGASRAPSLDMKIV